MTESVMERLNFKRKLMLSAGELLPVARRLSFGSDPQRKAGLSLKPQRPPRLFTTLLRPGQPVRSWRDGQLGLCA